MPEKFLSKEWSMSIIESLKKSRYLDRNQYKTESKS